MKNERLVASFPYVTDGSGDTFGGAQLGIPAVVPGRLFLSGTIIPGSLHGRKSVVKGGVDFIGMRVGGDADFRGMQVEGDANLDRVQVGGNADFRGMQVEGDANLGRVQVGGNADFRGMRVKGGVDLGNAQVKGYANLSGVQVERRTILYGARIGTLYASHDTLLRKLVLDSQTVIRSFGGEISVGGYELNGARLPQDLVDALDAGKETYQQKVAGRQVAPVSA
jgi:hypothetical protein